MTNNEITFGDPEKSNEGEVYIPLKVEQNTSLGTKTEGFWVTVEQVESLKEDAEATIQKAKNL